MRNYVVKEYQPHPIDYTHWSSSIALFGCSCVYGLHLDPKDQLHNVIDNWRPVNNFAYPGESNWHIWMKVIDAIRTHGMPERVCIGWTSPYRIAMYNEGSPAQRSVLPIGHWTKPDFTTAKIGKDWVLNMKMTQEEYSKLIVDSVELICGDKLTQWTLFHNLKDVKEGPGKSEWNQAIFDRAEQQSGMFTSETIDSSNQNITPIEFTDRASDGNHPGPETVKQMAKMIEKRL